MKRMRRTNRNRPAKPAPGPSDPLVGKVIEAKYRITGRLGSGAMGAVYVAKELSSGREVAIKVLHPGGGSNPVASERFQREASIVSMVNHPNIVRILDFGQRSDGGLYFAMEFVRGKSLAERLRQGALPVGLACALGQTLADAFAAVHEAGLVHRDLKPDNILLEQRGRRVVPKIVDFGIAHQRDTDRTRLTMEGVALGTPNYMSPEQARGQAGDARSDIYALGVVLYQMLSGNLPITATSGPAQLMAVVTEEPRPLPAELRARLPRDLLELMGQMLAKKPKDRPASMREVHDRLARLREEPSAPPRSYRGRNVAIVTAVLFGLGAAFWLGRPHLSRWVAALRGRAFSNVTILEETSLPRH